MMAGALDGIRIIDFTRILAGPYATMLMADLGAEVIKIEQPGTGDDTRTWGPPFTEHGESTYFEAVNRNKQSLVLDLKSRDGRQRAMELCADADVVIENFTPGVMLGFGLDYEALSAENSRLIYCSITGFGSAPVATGRPGYDLLVQAVGGLMSITGQPGDPTKAGVAVVDVITGLHAVMAIEAALIHRQRSGFGQQLEVSLMSSLLSALVNQGNAWVGGGVIPQAEGNAHPSIAPYESFRAADGVLVIAVGNDRQFAALADALDRRVWVTDRRFATNPARVANRLQLCEAMSEVLATQNVASWVSVLTAAGIPCGPVNDIAQAFEFATELGLEPIVEWQEAERTVRTIAHPVKYSLTPPTYRSSPPPLGNQPR